MWSKPLYKLLIANDSAQIAKCLLCVRLLGIFFANSIQGNTFKKLVFNQFLYCHYPQYGFHLKQPCVPEYCHKIGRHHTNYNVQYHTLRLMGHGKQTFTRLSSFCSYGFQYICDKIYCGMSSFARKVTHCIESIS